MTPPRLAATLALLLATPAAAIAPGRTAATDYVLARAADGAGDPALAARGYEAALAAEPGNRLLAVRAFRQSLAAGDERAALAAARRLQAEGAATADSRLMTIAGAIRERDWAAARSGIAAIPDGDPFAFAVPVLTAWIVVGEGGDPLAALVPGRGGAVAMPYLAEHRALLLARAGRTGEAVAALSAIGPATGGRITSLRVALAAALQQAKAPRDTLLALLTGEGPGLEQARALVSAGKPLPGAILTPADGAAVLMTRIAADLDRERVTPLALGLARIGTFLAPDRAEGWLVAAQALARSGATDAALAAAARVAPADPLAETGRDLTLALLVRADRDAEALAIAKAAVAAPGADAADWVRLGDIATNTGDLALAADALGRAVALSEGEARGRALVMQAGALEQSGQWPRAKALLEQAVALMPDSSEALNFLGYGELTHGGDAARATALIEKASRLAPEDAAITDSLGWAQYRQGRLAEAIASLERAAQGAPADADINEHLGDAYWAAGRRVEARYAWRAALVGAEAAARGRLSAKIENGPDARP